MQGMYVVRRTSPYAPAASVLPLRLHPMISASFDSSVAKLVSWINAFP